MPANGSSDLNAFLSRARVLIVDDEPASLLFMQHVMESDGYAEVTAMADPDAALKHFKEVDPDVVILDLWMPRSDNGFEFLAGVQELLPAGAYLPILIATADSSPESRRRALSLGAREFLTKPLSPIAIRMRVRNLLETRFLHAQVEEHKLLLERDGASAVAVVRLQEERDALEREVQRLRKQLLRRGIRKLQRPTRAVGQFS